MRILYLLPAVQHPTLRGNLRHFHFLRALGRRHEVTLLALAREAPTPEAERDLAAWTERTLLFPVADPPLPAAAGALARRAARRLGRLRALRRMRAAFLERAAEGRFDVVLFHGKEVHPVVAGFAGLPLVADFCDATALRERGRLRHARGAERLVALWRYASALRTDRALLRQTPHLAFISARDRTAAGGGPGAGVVIPNGIDRDYWRPAEARREPATLVFTGVMDFAPNEDAALYLLRELLPRLRAAVPGLHAWIVGRSPTPALLRASRGDEGVVVTGYVDDVRPFLERATVFVAPLRFGAGTQNKVLEALAMEVPVVATPLVADGLRVDGAGPPLRVAEGAGPFAAAVLALLADGAERRRLAREGRSFVAAHFDWERSTSMLLELCARAACRDAAPAPRPAGAPLQRAR